MKLNDRTLRHLLIDLEIDQTALAERTGISRGAINNVFCGRACSASTAQKLADALGVPLEELIEDRRGGEG